MHKKRLLSLILIMTMVLGATVNFDAASRPEKVKGVTAASIGKKTVTLKWKKAKRAKYYQIYKITKTYRSHGKTKYKYKKVGTTKKRTYKIKNLKPGKRYKFRLRAVRGKKKGKLSKIKAVTTKKNSSYESTELIIRVKKSSANAFLVSWNKTKGATSYNVKINNEAGKTVKKATTKKLSYEATNMSSGTYEIHIEANSPYWTFDLIEYDFVATTNSSDIYICETTDDYGKLYINMMRNYTKRKAFYTTKNSDPISESTPIYGAFKSLLSSYSYEPTFDKVVCNGKEYTKVYFEFDYRLTKTEMQQMFTNIDAVSQSLNGTAQQKVTQLADWLWTNCDYGSYRENEGFPSNISGVFVTKKAVCSGFSKAAEVILNQAGVPTKRLVDMSLDHAWNACKVNDKWYSCDFTVSTRVNGKKPMSSRYYDLLRGKNDAAYWNVSDHLNKSLIPSPAATESIPLVAK